MSQRWKTFGQTVVINSKSILYNLARLSIHLSIHPLTNEWCFNIDKGMINRDLFPNLKKAFDTVDHAILLTKLKYCGVETATINRFISN